MRLTIAARYGKILRGLRNAVVALGIFMLVCAGWHALLPLPDVAVVTPKLRYFAAHQNEFDTIFVGSSRVYRGIEPATFDATMRDRGVPTRSFNFGADGMHPPERFFVLAKILALRPHLRRIFVELDNLSVNWLPGEEGSQRTVYWHDWASTRIIFAKVLRLDRHEKLKRDWQRYLKSREILDQHFALFLRNETNVGRAQDQIPELLHSPTNEDLVQKIGGRAEGFNPFQRHLSSNAAVAYQNQLARESAETTSPNYLDTEEERAFRRVAAQIRALGAEPIFLVMPAKPAQPSRFHDPAPAPVLAFNSPATYPELYRSSIRVDDEHLNAEGATEFSRLLGQRVSGN
ncbi:MAG: hypothetical protein H0X40_15895 [Chthoniobacterales bacterium]|nr:hypothetical protein [Chthoniobacterales bacterium]